MVRDARFVLAHFSTSLSFAVAWRKPVIVLTTDELNDNRRTEYDYCNYIRRIAAALGVEPVNISRPPDEQSMATIQVNEVKYREYQNNYIKIEGSEALPLWQTVANRIKQHFATAPAEMAPIPQERKDENSRS